MAGLDYVSPPRPTACRSRAWRQRRRRPGRVTWPGSRPWGPDRRLCEFLVQRHVGEFAERTGIDLEVRILDSDKYFSNEIRAARVGRGRLHVRPGAALGARRPAWSSRSTSTRGRSGRRRLSTSLLEANRWTGRRRPARQRPAAGGPGQLRVLQPRVRAGASSSEPASTCRRRGTTSSPSPRVSSRHGGVRGFGQRGRRCGTRCTPATRPRCGICGRARLRPRRPLRVRRRRRGGGDDRVRRGAARRGPRRTGRTSAGTSSRSTSRGAATPARRLRPLRRVLRGRAPVRAGRPHRLRAAAGGAGRRAPPNLWTWSLAMTAASRDKGAARRLHRVGPRRSSCCAPRARAT